MSVLKPNRGNKTFSGRLTRWVDRLLPFDFEVVHVAGRTLGMADYLSRHPTELQGSSVKAETLWNEWFTVNSVISLNDVLDNSEASSVKGSQAESVKAANTVNRINQAKRRKPIKTQDERNSRETSKNHCSNTARTRKMNQSPSIKALNEKLLPAYYNADKLIQRVIRLLKNYNKTGVTRLPSPWREKFQAFSLDEREFLYMDNHLVIPQAMKPMIMCSLHYGHPGRDAMLAMIEDIWWPRIHREVIDKARLCEQCLEAGKNLKYMLKQKQIGKLPEAKEQNEEVALDFAGPFQNAKKGKKYLLVSVDHFSGWPDAKFLHSPTTRKVIEFLKQYFAQYGVPKKIRTDPGTVFVSEAFNQFCERFGINHVICPIGDHRGNGKIERLIRTINDRLRTNRQIILSKDKSGLSEILYSLRISKKKDGKSPFEKHMGKEPNTVKTNVVGKFRNISAQDPQAQFQTSDFQEDTDSTILVRERTKGSKLEPTFAKKTGKVIGETKHTIAILPRKAKQPKFLSKRDIASTSTEQTTLLKKVGRRAQINDTPSSSKSEQPSPKKGKTTKGRKVKTPEVAIEFEEERPPSIIDISSNTTEGEAQPKESDNQGKTQEKKESNAPSETTKTEKETVPVKATTSWSTEKRASGRKHIPTKRYGIDLVVNYPKDPQRGEEKEIEESQRWIWIDSKQTELINASYKLVN